MVQARPRPQVMRLTDAAAARIRALMARSGNPQSALRIMEYTMDWAEEPERFDEVIEDKGARVLIDSKAVMFLLGTEMDYQVDKLRAGFTFNNPNQTSACGCGESVQLAPATSESVEV